MGTFKWSLIAAPCAAFAIIALFAVDNGARAGTTQTLVKSDPATFVPAKHVSTDLEDRQITNHCIEAGRSKDDCVCVTKVLKYELSVGNYREIAQRVTPSERETRLLAADPYRDTIDSSPKRVDPFIRTVIDSPEFFQRCQASEAFFAPG